MIKAIADRLAEAFAEYLHEKVRKVYWGMRPMRTSAMRSLFARITGDPSGAGVSGLSGAHRKRHHLAAAGRRSPYRHEAHRIVRHVAGGIGFRLVLQPS